MVQQRAAMSDETQRDDTLLWVEWVQALELAHVTITAAIDPTGRLGPIGGLWPKLLAAAQDAATLGLLRVVVVAEEQSDVAPELLAPDASPLRVVKAATLWEAVHNLYEGHGPREAVRRYEQEQSATLSLLGASAPLVTYYQVLPLLQEVKRERLPQIGQERREELEPRDERDGFPEVDLVRWEEEVRQERVTYECVPVEQVFSDFYSVNKNGRDPVPRFVVLGPPGSGKSTLTQYLSWQAAQRRLQVSGRVLLPARIRLREWEAWAAKEDVLEQSLPQYLTERYKGLSPAPRPTQWRHWLQHGEVLLLLDGLDEIEGSPFFLTALKTALSTFTACPTVLTCRTVSFDQHRAICPGFPLFTLAGFDAAQRDAYIRTFPAEHRGDYDPERLITHLDRTFHILPLTANPLLLNIMCYVVDDASGLLPATRGMLYKKALEKLLAHHPQRVKPRYPGEEPALDDQLAVLERIALYLFVKSDQRLTFAGEELGHALKRALSEVGYGDAPAPWANALRVDLTENSGILRGSPSQGFFFLHLTIQEFLAAAAIARLVNEHGWDAPVEIINTKVSVRRLVDSKVWEPRWQEVMVLLAGQLHDPLPLLRLLADERSDDLFRWRLALAALCLPEVQLTESDHHTAIFDRIVTDTFSLWFQHEQNSSSAAVLHLARALPALGQVHGRIKGVPLFHWLCQRLHNPSAEVRLGVVEAFGQIGQSVAQHAEGLWALVQATRHDTDELVRTRAVEALGRIRGEAAQRPEVLSALLQAALHDEDWFVRSGAVRAMGQMGIVGVERAEILSTLNAALLDENVHVRSHAAEALRQVDGTTAPHAVTIPQLQAPQEKNVGIPPTEIATVPHMGEAAAQPAEIHAIVQALSAEDSEMRRDAARTLGQMEGGVTQSPEVLLALGQALYDKDGGVRSETAKALGQMKEALLQHPQVLSTLVEVSLHDKDGGVRTEIAATFGRIGAAIASHASVLLALVRLVLHDKDGGVRARAAGALGEIGEAAARQPEVTSALLQAVHDTDSNVRFRAAEALGRIMAQGVRLFRRRWGKVEVKETKSLSTLSPIFDH